MYFWAETKCLVWKTHNKCIQTQWFHSLSRPLPWGLCNLFANVFLISGKTFPCCSLCLLPFHCTHRDSGSIFCVHLSVNKAPAWSSKHLSSPCTSLCLRQQHQGHRDPEQPQSWSTVLQGEHKTSSCSSPTLGQPLEPQNFFLLQAG